MLKSIDRYRHELLPLNKPIFGLQFRVSAFA